MIAPLSADGQVNCPPKGLDTLRSIEKQAAEDDFTASIGLAVERGSASFQGL